jgi:hypothetical protein
MFGSRGRAEGGPRPGWRLQGKTCAACNLACAVVTFDDGSRRGARRGRCGPPAPTQLAGARVSLRDSGSGWGVAWSRRRPYGPGSPRRKLQNKMPDIAAGITSGASDVVAVKWSVGKPNAILTPLLTPLGQNCVEAIATSSQTPARPVADAAGVVRLIVNLGRFGPNRTLSRSV